VILDETSGAVLVHKSREWSDPSSARKSFVTAEESK